MSDNLAATGAGTFVIGSAVIGLPLFITAAAALVLGGAIIYRLATRSARRSQEA